MDKTLSEMKEYLINNNFVGMDKDFILKCIQEIHQKLSTTENTLLSLYDYISDLEYLIATEEE